MDSSHHRCQKFSVLRFIFVKFFASGLKKRYVLVSTETLWLMATGKATREALLSEAGLRRFSRPRIGSVGASCFVDDFVPCWASGVHIRCCLNPVEVSFLLFGFVWWLDCLLLKEGPSAFCSVIGDCLRLEVFLVVAEFAGFRAGGRLLFG